MALFKLSHHAAEHVFHSRIEDTFHLAVLLCFYFFFALSMSKTLRSLPAKALLFPRWVLLALFVPVLSLYSIWVNPSETWEFNVWIARALASTLILCFFIPTSIRRAVIQDKTKKKISLLTVIGLVTIIADCMGTLALYMDHISLHFYWFCHTLAFVGWIVYWLLVLHVRNVHQQKK